MAESYRIGLGNDIHRLAAGKPLVIGGVKIDHDSGPDAHSDGDVLLHSLVDGLLGAAGLGDIGDLFPDSDEAYLDMESSKFVLEVMRLLKTNGWRPVNVDAVVMAQSPKLSPHKAAIRERVAELTGLPVEAVNIKAKTGEKVGPIGREEAIAAEVVVLIEKDSDG